MSRHTNRSTLAVLVVAFLVVGMLAVGGVVGQQETDDETDDQEETFLRVAHASPDAPAVDVYVDGEQVLSDVEFGDVSDYQALTAGDHDVEIRLAGEEEETVFQGNVTLDPRRATTLYAAGEVDDASQPFEPILYDDDAFEPGEDESAVAVVHLSPDAPTVDLTANDGDVVLAENVSFGDASDYVTVSSGDVTVEVRPATADNDGDVVATADLTLEEETAYSVLAIGYVDSFDSEMGEEFQITAVEDATVTIDLPGEDEEETTPEAETPAVETPNETVEATPDVVNETPTAEPTPEVGAEPPAEASPEEEPETPADPEVTPAE